EFHVPGHGQAAPGKLKSRDRQIKTSRGWFSSCPQQTPALDQLPANKPWNSKTEFAHSRNQRQRESCVARNSEKTPDKNVAALLTADSAGNSKGDIANSQHGALQNDRTHYRRVQVERAQRDPDFSGIQNQRENCPDTTSDHGVSPRVKSTHGL